MTARPVSPPVLRWEWRTFAHELGEVRERLPDLSRVKPAYSRETYVVSELVPHSARIRFDELDVKRLVQVDAQGLQLWDPVLKGTFPIGADVAARLYRIWRLPLPGFTREHYSLTLFLEEIVSPSRELHIAEIQKTRQAFVCEGCMAEVARVVVNGIPLESLCLEHEQEAAVLGAMNDLGLAGARNVSYPQAIKDVLGLTALPAPA